MDEDEVEHVQRANRPYALDQRRFAVAVEGLQREPAGVDFAVLAHELRDLVVEVLSAGEGFVAELRETALHAERDARAVKQDRGLESLALKARRLQEIDEADRAFESDRVESDKGLLSRLRLYVLKDLLLIIDQKIPLLMGGSGDCWHCADPLADAGAAGLLETERNNRASTFGSIHAIIQD